MALSCQLLAPESAGRIRSDDAAHRLDHEQHIVPGWLNCLVMATTAVSHLTLPINPDELYGQ